MFTLEPILRLRR